jgi:sugar lactone lactonase YvrE
MSWKPAVVCRFLIVLSIGFTLSTVETSAQPEAEVSPGTITNWEVSRAIKAERVNRETYPGFMAIFGAGWQKVEAEPSGLVDIGRYATRSEGGPDLVFARTIVRASEAQDVKFSFGYSDEVDLFLNGRKVFSANSAHRSRDPSFLGIIGPFDEVVLTLEKGLNEIFLMVTENFGGWGLLGVTDPELLPPIVEHDRVTKVWETSDTFLTPESVLYDPERGLLYVSNYDINTFSTPDLTGYISKLSLDGEVLEERWVSDLKGPAGMNIFEGKLYVAERSSLTEIDLATGEILQRHEIPGSQFLNDVAIDADGYVYVTDTYPSSHTLSRVYRFKDGDVEEWYGGREIGRANGLHLHGNELFIGNSGDGVLKAVDLEHMRLRKIACFGAGVIDGTRVDNSGNYIVSKWDGQVFSVSPDGDVVEILDLMPDGMNTADFEFIAEQNLLVIPTFLGNRVVAYRLN